jgi:hypothetical protein
MSFETFSDRLKIVVNESLALCKANWGGSGLKKEEPIDPKISWRPTFYMKPNRFLIVAVEVNDVLFPEILKIAAHDIERHDYPISVYQACSLEVYQKDRRFTQIRLLREHGFGIITVDDAGSALIQVRAEPLAQYIPSERFDSELKPLTPRLKVKFKDAYATYQTNVGQGLQEAGQIVEELLGSIATQAEAAGAVPSGTCAKISTADKIDDLYSAGAFHNYRAALGGARSFVKTYRNVASHPPRTAKEAVAKIRKCKDGFFEALRIAGELRAVIQQKGYQVRVV